MQALMLYPEKRWVPEERIRGWASDVSYDLRSQGIEPEVDLDDPEDCIRFLQEYDDITFSIHRR
jgi:hypothetical protein